MKAIKKIKSLFPHKKDKSKSKSNSGQGKSVQEREKMIYEQDKLSRQKLYEKWSCKDKWRLYEEGIPLLFGISPESKEVLEHELKKDIDDLWLHAKDCVQKKLLSVINQEQSEGEWEVRPVDLYRWATVSRIAMPDEFSALMAFVVQTVKSEEVNPTYIQTGDSGDALYQKHREIILGAATSLLINVPDLCKNKKGKISTRQIIKNILENETQWFGDQKLLLSQSAMMDLIDGYLKLTRPTV